MPVGYTPTGSSELSSPLTSDTSISQYSQHCLDSCLRIKLLSQHPGYQKNKLFALPVVADFKHLEQKLRKVTSLDKWALTWEDPDGDLIAIQDAEDWTEIVHCHLQRGHRNRTLKLTVTEPTQPVIPQALAASKDERQSPISLLNDSSARISEWLQNEISQTPNTIAGQPKRNETRLPRSFPRRKHASVYPPVLRPPPFVASQGNIKAAATGTGTGTSTGNDDEFDEEDDNPDSFETSSTASGIQESPFSTPARSAHEATINNVDAWQPPRVPWTRGRVLGKGGFGTVYLGLHQESGELLAVKEICLESEHYGGSATVEKLRSLQREITMMEKLIHPNIVRYMGTDFSDKGINIFLEYIPGGSISGLLQQFGPFKETLVRGYVKQILMGLQYLHGQNVIHRDIKGGNILVSNTGEIKLADFGSSKCLQEIIACRSDRDTHCGTVEWMAPEAIVGKNVGIQADVWSLGCTVLEMIHADTPWSRTSRKQANSPDVTTMYYIATSSDRPDIPSNLLTPEACSFLDQCLQRDPKCRSPMDILINHVWVCDVSTPGPPSMLSAFTGLPRTRSSTTRQDSDRHSKLDADTDMEDGDDGLSNSGRSPSSYSRVSNNSLAFSNGSKALSFISQHVQDLDLGEGLNNSMSLPTPSLTLSKCVSMKSCGMRYRPGTPILNQSHMVSPKFMSQFITPRPLTPTSLRAPSSASTSANPTPTAYQPSGRFPTGMKTKTYTLALVVCLVSTIASILTKGYCDWKCAQTVDCKFSQAVVCLPIYGLDRLAYMVAFIMYFCIGVTTMALRSLL